ncbi:hypothetical protein GQ43DRAFT_190953 [Delitschia confertaspora ATCC 74209]|uniref:Uncharacterized protein n=1 Tax=Delitschia confertaspora ATCC 74209 TaxID=1513339 RepID=A0A9P4JID7_9PLEO|nr:hypothetical protein GQ43DRAFT_190953 [Delitschia confertaspora ATCC 74209]
MSTKRARLISSLSCSEQYWKQISAGAHRSPPLLRERRRLLAEARHAGTQTGKWLKHRTIEKVVVVIVHALHLFIFLLYNELQTSTVHNATW